VNELNAIQEAFPSLTEDIPLSEYFWIISHPNIPEPKLHNSFSQTRNAQDGRGKGLDNLNRPHDDTGYPLEGLKEEGTAESPLTTREYPPPRQDTRQFHGAFPSYTSVILLRQAVNRPGRGTTREELHVLSTGVRSIHGNRWDQTTRTNGNESRNNSSPRSRDDSSCWVSTYRSMVSRAVMASWSDPEASGYGAVGRDRRIYR
jgi:hypothetical protein